jgi:RHH-type proline utilization regulon transcriptional repressor/proline dehydrogenase/delta 1-pyrroline-5-carboxylate dehydrogenase
MLVDSTALPEQVSGAVMQSAFRSADQRCSALRLLCVHEDIADKVIAMISGAAKELVAGDPADLATDVGPVIDREVLDGIQTHLQRLHREATPLLGFIENQPVAQEKQAQAATKPNSTPSL